MAKTAAERSREYRERHGATPRGPLKPHGTIAAARRHQRAGESLRRNDTVCWPCTDALAEYQNKMYEQRKNRKGEQDGTGRSDAGSPGNQGS